MKSLADFALYNVAWTFAVVGAANGSVWLGVGVFLVAVALHVAWLVPRGERRAAVVFAIGLGLVGALVDTGLHALGVTSYPTSTEAWPYLFVPPWIVALWFGFSTMARYALGWLDGRPLLAAALGAIGGPLAYFGGTRFGAVAIEHSALLTYGALAVEYALLTPLIVAAAPVRAGWARGDRAAQVQGA
ncbi:MAG: DUF2878 domain-containing protein [Planctomycetota bacterium]